MKEWIVSFLHSDFANYYFIFPAKLGTTRSARKPNGEIRTRCNQFRHLAFI